MQKEKKILNILFFILLEFNSILNWNSWKFFEGKSERGMPLEPGSSQYHIPTILRLLGILIVSISN